MCNSLMYPIGQVVITTASYIESIMGEAPVLSSVTQEKSSLWDRITPHQVKHLAAGGIAGAVSRTSVSPFERLKILYQVCCMSPCTLYVTPYVVCHPVHCMSSCMLYVTLYVVCHPVCCHHLSYAYKLSSHKCLGCH